MKTTKDDIGELMTFVRKIWSQLDGAGAVNGA